MVQRVLFVLLFFCSLGVDARDTVLKLYRPYGEVIEQVAPLIKNTVTGQCTTQSHLIVREDAWRCEAEGKIFDPCFVKAGNNRTEAVCPESPWVANSTKIKVPTSLNNEKNQALDMSQSYPWGIELTNGEHCLAIKSTEAYDQMPIRYRCTNENVLVGPIQRCKNTWSMPEKTAEGIVTAEFAKVWF